MALSGSISEFGLAEIFQLIFHQKQEGILNLSHNKENITIFFKEGLIVRANQGAGDEELATKLIDAELVTEDQLVIARYRQEHEKKALETALVELEVIPSIEMKRLSRLFTEEIIYRIFNWSSGDYEFKQEEISFNPLLISPLETQFVLMEAVRQFDEWPMLRKRIPSKKAVYEKSKGAFQKKKPILKAKIESSDDPFASFEESGSAEEEVENEDADWLLGQIDGETSVQDLIDRARLGEFSIYQGLVELLAEDKVQEKMDLIQLLEEVAPGMPRERILKYTIGVGISLISSFFIFFSLSSMENTSLSAARSFDEVSALSQKNERFFIRYALDLYYLKHNRYPDALDALVGKGFFGKKTVLVKTLGRWQYERQAGESETFVLSPK